SALCDHLTTAGFADRESPVSGQTPSTQSELLGRDAAAAAGQFGHQPVALFRRQAAPAGDLAERAEAPQAEAAGAVDGADLDARGSDWSGRAGRHAARCARAPVKLQGVHVAWFRIRVHYLIVMFRSIIAANSFEL